MTYQETLHYLYTSIPVFQHSGASAYKPGLGTSIALDNYLGNPHCSYKSVHVAGTNGKGSTCHLLAAILQESGYKVGLFTSPHLVDFRERIRINGKMISEDYVINFVEKHKEFFEPLKPSFFELTSAMALAYFADEKVDFAVIETGLGGRLDSTNIISPVLSVITNISKDHVQFLGDTLEKIAFEKAGIIKPHTPVVIGDVFEPSVMQVFLEKAHETESKLISSVVESPVESAHLADDGKWRFQTKEFGEIVGELGGAVQVNNAATVLTAVKTLCELNISITTEAVAKAFSSVVELTGLMGRWQKLQSNPKVICDTGHNTGGWEYLSRQLSGESSFHTKLRMVVGMVNDKDINGVLDMMPRNAEYYFTRADIARAMPEDEFAALASNHGLKGRALHSVEDAVNAALADSAPDDMVFIGGSTFIVAEAIPLFIKKKTHKLINS